MKNFIFVLFILCFGGLSVAQAQFRHKPLQPKISHDNQNRLPTNAIVWAETPQTESSEPETRHILTELSFWVHDVEYTGLLAMENGVGKMRIHYDSPNDSDPCKIIEQTMHLVQTANGAVYLQGSDPVDVHTGRWANYHPDNIFISQDKSGNLTFLNVDDQGNRANVEMQAITSEARLKKLRSFYNWEE
jgi:hypothetical protein